MPKLRLLTVHFDTEIPAKEIPHFRGAIVDRVGREHDLFHNHKSQNGYHYRYPLIQYKRHHKKPMLLCLGEGVMEAQRIFAGGPLELPMKNRTLSLEEYRLNLHQSNVQLWKDAMLTYRIRDWLALSQEAHREYEQLLGLAERIQFLERRLRNNILTFAKGVGWHVAERIECRLLHLEGPYPKRDYQTVLQTFNATFQTNVSLPNLIGLGKSVSRGYGVVVREKGEE